MNNTSYKMIVIEKKDVIKAALVKEQVDVKEWLDECVKGRKSEDE